MSSTTETSRLTDLLLGHRAMPDGSFLQRLSTRTWQAMLQAQPRTRVFARDELLPLGADDRYVYIVIEGCVRQDRFPLGTAEGMPTITRFRGIGQLVGEAKLIGESKLLYSRSREGRSHVPTRCLSQTVVIPWRARYMNQLLRRQPEVQLALLRSLEDRSRCDELVYAMATRPPFERVSRLFTHLADIAGVPDPRTSQHTVITGPSQKDMAAALQLSTSTVENAIRTLRYHGVVEARYRKFLVHDLEALRQFATGA
ncbi:Crp/Fnr family transcriptional regulator [Streptomyces sp. NPDC058295]|jgi:CRP-like cAMP-binding protein|uniref:Crp/Fnr family transcriptional regulator n=1 Tax=Streptomyces sp. NPDC058295 TaxID=3346431 RepID=UPI0036E5A24A